MSPTVITLIFLAFAIIMFVTEKIPLGLTSMIVCIGLVITGVLSVSDAFNGFINSNVILFVAMFIVGGALLGVPLAKWSMDLIFPYFISNVAIGMDLQFPPQLYGMIYGGILICYLVINFLLVGRLNKLVPAEVLKNRE